ncbi:MAG: NAD(P)(+) transhydrogenase (Re/Si-specific) subunit beta [Planctomycetes bacterium]|nr:NAD(P)(+) transhydrogenase (Re/Si-specific) subunit beta [Planctomycetota bacterium]
MPLVLLAQASDPGDKSASPSPSPSAVKTSAEGVESTDGVPGTDSVQSADDAKNIGDAADEADAKGWFSQDAINIAYLIAAVLFIRGMKGLTHPRTAVRGNMMAGVGMLVAVFFALGTGGLSYTVIFFGLAVGGVLGAYKAVKVEMTDMPEMVALFNGFGGVGSVFVAGAAMMYESVSMQGSIATALSGFIGAVTLTGSLVAYAKLKGIKWVPDGQIIPAQKMVNALLVLAAVALSWWLTTSAGTGASPYFAYWLIVLVACVLGILLTTPIGGADMPVVIALLNSYSGLAACATGFVINNNVLIIAGSLVGASGLILCGIMCKAMNRSLKNVIFAKLGPTADTPDAEEVYKTVKTSSPEEVAILFDSAQKAVIVPGYGLAVSQAQHAVRDLSNLLESRGCHVDFAVHPVAGRMPGHMNVLLAEANIDYDRLREMDDINPEMEQYDVALVIGANDVVNPVARTDPNSPIAGMPIIDVDKCRTVVVVKRSLSPGFAGIPNPLFAAENTLMMFGDGKKAILELIAAIKEG